MHVVLCSKDNMHVECFLVILTRGLFKVYLDCFIDIHFAPTEHRCCCENTAISQHPPPSLLSMCKNLTDFCVQVFLNATRTSAYILMHKQMHCHTSKCRQIINLLLILVACSSSTLLNSSDIRLLRFSTNIYFTQLGSIKGCQKSKRSKHLQFSIPFHKRCFNNEMKLSDNSDQRLYIQSSGRSK